VKQLSATFMAMLFVDTLGAIAPFSRKVYLPSPRMYLATFLLWGIFGLVASVSDAAARVVGRLSLLMLLTATVIGPFGRKAVNFLNATTAFFPAEQGGSS
jgi:hypothetical protein